MLFHASRAHTRFLGVHLRAFFFLFQTRAKNKITAVRSGIVAPLNVRVTIARCQIMVVISNHNIAGKKFTKRYLLKVEIVLKKKM